jgi:hypothetical protein
MTGDSATCTRRRGGPDLARRRAQLAAVAIRSPPTRQPGAPARMRRRCRRFATIRTVPHARENRTPEQSQRCLRYLRLSRIALAGDLAEHSHRLQCRWCPRSRCRPQATTTAGRSAFPTSNRTRLGFSGTRSRPACSTRPPTATCGAGVTACDDSEPSSAPSMNGCEPAKDQAAHLRAGLRYPAACRTHQLRFTVLSPHPDDVTLAVGALPCLRSPHTRARKPHA